MKVVNSHIIPGHGYCTMHVEDESDGTQSFFFDFPSHIVIMVYENGYIYHRPITPNDLCDSCYDTVDGHPVYDNECASLFEEVPLRHVINAALNDGFWDDKDGLVRRLNELLNLFNKHGVRVVMRLSDVEFAADNGILSCITNRQDIVIQHSAERMHQDLFRCKASENDANKS